MAPNFWISLPLAYLVGAIPFGVIICRLIARKDPHHHGTGNMGASNVGVVAGPVWGLLTYLLDIGKGAFAAWLGGVLTGNPWGIALAGLAAVVGHDFSIFLGFRGGKGVATTTGALWFVDFRLALLIYGSWILFILLTRYFILSTLINFVIMDILIIGLGLPWAYVFFGLAATVLAIFQHRRDLMRIFAGHELTAKAQLAKYIQHV